MAERLLRPRVVSIGKALAERVPAKRSALHEWVAERLTQGFCTRDSYDTTVYFELEDLVSGGSMITDILRNTISGTDESKSVLLIDLTANPYDLLPEPLLGSVAEFAGCWWESGVDRMVVILIPRFTALKASLFWPPLEKVGQAGKLFVIANDGITVRRTDTPTIDRVDTFKGYARRQGELLGSVESRIERKTLRKLGHFPIHTGGNPHCARRFFDASLATDDIAQALEDRITRRILPSHESIALLIHGPRSSWMHEAGLNAAALLGVDRYDVSVPDHGIPDITAPTVGVLVVDVVNTGQTLSEVVARLRAAGVRLASRTIAVLVDNSAPVGEFDDDLTLEYFVKVDTEKVPTHECQQCMLGLPYTDPLREQQTSLRTFDAWSMLLSSSWGPEPYGPTGLTLFGSAPDMEHIIAVYGDFLAYKIEVIVEALEPRNELVFVCPDEPHIKTLMDKLGPRFHDRFVAVHIRRNDFETEVIDDAGTDRAAWRKQLTHLALAKSASVVIVDELNASSTTAASLIRLLRSFGVDPSAYVPILDRDGQEEIGGVGVFPLYSIPSPRRMPDAAG